MEPRILTYACVAAALCLLVPAGPLHASDPAPKGTVTPGTPDLSEGELLQRALDSFHELQNLRNRDWNSIPWGEVLDKCNEILAINPEYVDLIMTKAEAYRELKSPRKNLETLLALYEIMPERVDLQGQLGSAHAALGQYGKAVAAYTKATQLEPDNPWPWQCLGDFHHFNRNQHAQALPYYEHAVMLAKPGYNLQYLFIHYACSLRDAGQAAKAREIFAQAREYAAAANDPGALQRIADESRRLQ